MTNEINNNDVKFPGRLWLISLIVLCLGIVTFGFYFSKNDTFNIPYLIGYNLPVMALLWGVFHVIFERDKNKDKAKISLILVCTSLIFSNIFGYYKQKNSAIQVVKEIQQSYSSITKSSANDQGIPQVIDKQINTTPKAQGEFGGIETFMKEFMNKIVMTRNNYLIELDAIKWSTILDPKRLEKDKSLAESIFIINRAKDIVKKYKIKMHNLYDEARNDISKIEVSYEYKQSLEKGLEQGIKESLPKLNAVWDIESQIIDEFESIISLLNRKNKKWIVQNGMIYFTEDATVDNFNKHLSSIRELVAKQSEIQKQSVDATNDKLNSIIKKYE